jgi:predicted enzyme related to lactoylglutathione lyase
MSREFAKPSLPAVERVVGRVNIGGVNWLPSPYRGGELVVVIDCADLDRAARFWSGVLGYLDEGQSIGRYRTLRPADGPGAEVLLQRTADDKHGKNRVHVDLRTRDLDAEVSRVTALGAIVLTGESIVEGGWRWHVLADPDGNEFDVLQPPASYWAEHK